MSKVLVIGGGAAGMFAAIAAAENGNEGFLYEKNERSCLLQEKGDAISRMPVIWIRSLRRL